MTFLETPNVRLNVATFSVLNNKLCQCWLKTQYNLPLCGCSSGEIHAKKVGNFDVLF